MKGPAKLSLAIALALTGGNAFALGLGTIQVKSRLNQPLEAVIPVIADSPAEANGLEVSLASAEDFQRVGLDRSRVDVPLEFSVATERGQTVIKVSTKDIVREPLVDFLIVANWPKGKLLREYTVLLDPPVTAPAAGAALSPAHEAPRAKPQPLPPEHEHAAPKAAHVKPPRAETAQAKPAQAKPAPKPAAEKPAAAPHAAGAGEYGPVAAGETLSEIAGATRPDDKTNLDAMMLAMLKANPNAFYRDNINALKRGAILRIPTADEIKAGGNAATVAAAVRDQNQAWAANAPIAKPTLVAKTGAPKSESAPASTHKETPATGGSHLALVPPGAGKGKQNSSDRPGAASGTGNAQVASDLARTKEALASREQEVGELKSRVKDLEKIDGDNKRLLTFKQNEIAELQAKLKQLEAASAAKPAAAAVVAAAPAKPAEAKPAETKPAVVLAAKPGEAATAKEAPKLTAKDIWGDINASEKPGEAKPGAAPAQAAPPPAAKAPESTTPATVAAAATAPEKAAEAKPTETKPASTPVAVKPKAPAKVEPISAPGLPWWQNNNVLMASGAALLIIGLLVLMRFMRKPKVAVVPAAGVSAAHEEHLDAMAADEQHLLDQLAQHPGDAVLSLQLLDLYYAHQDAARFEATAEAMYAHLADPTSDEWQQVRAMGEHLCPHNPLFGGHEDLGATLHDMHTATEHAEHDHMHRDDGHLDAGDFHTQQMPKPAEDSFDFDLADHAASVHVEPAHAEPAYVPPPAPVHAEPAYVPPPVPEPVHVAAPASAPAAAKSNEDFFAGEDAIGTKLDLAKAYLDMGDPEGARSMLDEVLAEGNDAQKIEARKLLAEIG
ncbi:MAG TPA: FimV/HubP family polar landmark protein [Rudaea sp.]|nr:FimV/HubP family polar landmark protein [Rudaea sp.]